MNKDIEELKNKFKTLQSNFLIAKGKREIILENIKSLDSQAVETEDRIQLYQKTNSMLQIVSTLLQDKVKVYFNDLITKALRFIFEREDYSFELDFKILRNVLNAKFNIKNDFTSGDPKLMSGGGVVDIISEAFRIAVLELYNPKIEGPIVLDERFKNLSEDFVSNAAQFLSEASKKFDRQIILITHQEEFIHYAGKVFRL